MLADDHLSALEAYSRALEDEYNINVIGKALNGQELIDLVSKTTPDIVLLDIEMPVMNGFETLQVLAKNHPSVKTIMLSTHNEKFYISHFILNGASAYLSKNCALDDIVATINEVYTNNYHLSKDLSQIVLGEYMSDHEKKKEAAAMLTSREVEILQKVCDGFTNKQVGDSLGISIDTVKFHIKSIYKKTDLDSVAPLIKYAVRNGITTLD